jgi:hypothetical protein
MQSEMRSKQEVADEAQQVFPYLRATRDNVDDALMSPKD